MYRHVKCRTVLVCWRKGVKCHSLSRWCSWVCLCSTSYTTEWVERWEQNSLHCHKGSDAAPDKAPGCLAPDVGGSEGNILLEFQLSFAVSDSFFGVSVFGLLLWDLLYLWSHSSPQDCRGIVAGVVWSSVVYSKRLPIVIYLWWGSDP